MIDVLIVSKTRMSRNVCVGGVLENGRFVRLLDLYGQNQPVDTIINIGDIYAIEFFERPNITPPHIEDILVTSALYRSSLKSFSDIINYLKEHNVPFEEGGIDAIFDNRLSWTSNGSGYISETMGLPEHSVGFWLPDQNLTKLNEYNNKIKYSYGISPIRKLAFVGLQEPKETLTAGTLVRLSLARWWSPNNNIEKRCYLQLSGWYPSSENIHKITSDKDKKIQTKPGSRKKVYIPTIDNSKLIEKTFVGIDFGTSTTVVSIAYYDPEKKYITTKSIPLNQKMLDGAIYKSEIIPTIIAWYKNSLLIGEGAKNIRLKRVKNRNIWYSFKMDLGKKNNFLYEQSELSEGEIKLLNAKDATAIFFRYLYSQIHKYIEENGYPQQVEYSISVPASFELNQRKDLLESLEENQYHFNEQAFIDEPNAAFLSYISNEDTQKNICLSSDFTAFILVFDYGAGTCDISILEMGLKDGKFISKNIAISKFEYIGGKEVDKLIAIDILFPQLLKENKLSKHHFTTLELKRYILPRLEKYAESLKIEVCKSISLQENRIDYSNYEEVFTLGSSIKFKTRKGNYSIIRPKIKFTEFSDIIDIFTDPSTRVVSRLNDGKNFYSIFNPIKTALEKAKLSSNDIDYVLFIGGSSKNPLIQKALKKYFTNSEYLIPDNLQTHVSSGAAINSLLYNGLKERRVAPITNDTLYVIVSNNGREELVRLVSAGSPLPTGDITITNLITPKATNKIELPICLLDEYNILYNISISGECFKKGESIELTINIDSNRTICCYAKINNTIKQTIIENSLLSSQYPKNKKEKLERIEFEYSKSVAENGGYETKKDLYNLYKKYEDIGEYNKAAEIAEELYFKHGQLSLNSIGILYSNAGNDQQANYYYLRAAKEERSATAYFNLALHYEYTNKEKYVEYLKKALEIRPNYDLAKYELLCYQSEYLDDIKAKTALENLYRHWKSEYENNQFSYHYSWLVSCAKQHRDYEFSNKIEKENKINHNNSQLYNKNYLATTIKGE